MYCERCKKIEATIHLTEIIKDIKSEIHLCEECAREIGLNSKLSSFSLTVPEMLSFLDTNDVIDGDGDDTVCMNCGRTYMEYSRDGKLGCPDCYSYLIDSLKSNIVSYHNNERHVGKSPRNVTVKKQIIKEKQPQKNVSREETYRLLVKDLEKAVSDENYEQAAVIRDKLKEYK